MAEYNIENDQGKVRLLISDIGGADGKSFLFEDNEIAAFLAMNDSNIRLAAAEALRAIAGNESQVSKRIKFLELSTDGPAVSKELRALAKSLEEKADDDVEPEIASMSETWVPEF